MPDAMPFTPLSDTLLPPPFSSLIALLFVVGLWGVGHLLAGRLWHPADRHNPVWNRSVDGRHWAFGFVIVTAALSALVQMVGLLGGGSHGLLATMGGLFVGVGVAATLFMLPAGGQALKRLWRENLHWEQRLGWGLCLLILIGLGAVTLGPPIGSDSMAYHLAEPARWLREEAITEAPPHAMFSRLMGLGEVLIWVGLALGSDVVSALLQLSGLLVAWIALDAMARDWNGRLLAALFVLSTPLIVSFVPNQKPQMLPMALMVLVLTTLAGDRNLRTPSSAERKSTALDSSTWGAMLIVLLFAIGQKHAFLISGGVVGFAVLVRGWQVGRLPLILTAGALVFMVILAPLYGRNLLFYGDPLAPLLSAWLSGATPDALGFAAYLHTFRESYLEGSPWLRFFVGHAVPLSPEFFVEILGVGLYASLWTLPHRTMPQVRWLLIPAGCGALLFVLTGNITARYYTEFHLMAGAAVVTIPWGRSVLLLRRLLTVQALVVAVIALSGAAMLFPGALRPAWRHQVMEKRSFGYAENLRLDRMLPLDAVILPYERVNYAFLPRRSVFFDGGFWIPDDLFVARLRESITRHGVTHMLVEEPVVKGVDFRLCMPLGSLQEITSYRAGLNPFHEVRTKRTLLLITLDPERPGCPLARGGSV
ncbi:MAG: DUF1420 family protein [Magnetococcales bacterium]|nr:DUF1420 family protein [Magnetococcales bacterium]